MLADNQHYFWQPEVPFYGNDNNRWKIDVDDTVTPLIVSFEPNLFHTSAGAMPLAYDRGCDCTTGHRPTQILESVDPCYPYCEAVYNNCPMCSTQTGAATPCVAPFSESVDGVFDFISGRPYNICTGDGIRCSSTNLIYHESLSKTEAMVEVGGRCVGLLMIVPPPDGRQRNAEQTVAIGLVAPVRNLSQPRRLYPKLQQPAQILSK